MIIDGRNKLRQKQNYSQFYILFRIAVISFVSNGFKLNPFSCGENSISLNSFTKIF